MDEAYTIKEIMSERFTEMTSHLSEIKSDVKETKAKVEFQNGRVRKLEDWSNDAKKILDTSADVLGNYKSDRTRIWTGMSILLLLGGVIITLSILAIDDKIEDGINSALSAYNIEIK